MRISRERAVVFKGTVTDKDIADAMSEPWNRVITANINHTIKCVHAGLYTADWDEDTDCVCIITTTNGPYTLATIFLEHN